MERAHPLGDPRRGGETFGVPRVPRFQPDLPDRLNTFAYPKHKHTLCSCSHWNPLFLVLNINNYF